jgi:putative oxidoreductase
MPRALFTTEESFAPFLLRLVLAIVFFPHGAQKLLGWFGGVGFSGTMGFFTQQMGIPAVLAFLVIVIEFFAPIGLVLGLLTRVAALGIAVEMVVAALRVHVPNGFFMNWAGSQKGEGFEFHILAVGIAVAILITGAGRWSVDAAIAGKMRA